MARKVSTNHAPLITRVYFANKNPQGGIERDGVLQTINPKNLCRGIRPSRNVTTGTRCVTHVIIHAHGMRARAHALVQPRHRARIHFSRDAAARLRRKGRAGPANREAANATKKSRLPPRARARAQSRRRSNQNYLDR